MIIILFIFLLQFGFSKQIYTNDFLDDKQDFVSSQQQKLDFNIDILDGAINNSFVKPDSARVETIIYILDSGCYPLLKSFVNDSIGYHGIAVFETLQITLPKNKTNVQCIKTLPTFGGGILSNYIKALKYILTLKKKTRVIINISASVSSGGFVRIDSLIKKMARKGYEFVIAAGNLGPNSPLGPNACLYGMTNLAWLKNVYVVGSDQSYSRTGECVEYKYPGTFKTIHPFSGTSFSAPIFTGLLTTKNL